VSVVWKEETVVFVRDRVRVERTALGIVGRQIKVVEAAQDEASQTILPGEPPKAKILLLEEGQSLLWYFALDNFWLIKSAGGRGKKERNLSARRQRNRDGF
jgi:hypothetical protein